MTTFVGWNVYFRGAYEHETLGILAALTKPGHVVVEVGANEGFHSIFAAWCVGPSGRVLAFEPNPVPRRTLEQNVERLGWNSRLNVIPHAVGDAASRRRFFMPDRSAENQGVGGFANNSTVPVRPVEVEVVTLDAVCVLARCDLMKLDAQGAEELILRGATSLIAKFRPSIYFEVGLDGGDGAGRLLAEAGYRLLKVVARSRPPYYSLSPYEPGFAGNVLALPR